MNRKTLRSIGAVLAGALASIVVTVGTDAVLQAIGVFPPAGQPSRDAPLLLATIYRAIYGVAGSYLTARLAPDRPMQHALALGGIGTAIGIVGVVVTWGQASVVGHEWYPIALTVLGMPQSWLGGALYRRTQAQPSRAQET